MLARWKLGSVVLTLSLALAPGLACGPADTGTGGADAGPPPVGDGDEDGYDGNVDCNDDDAEINPGMPEICDYRDNDCSGDIDEPFDVDMDGVPTCGGDCDDADPTVFTGASEIADGKDNDCDTLIDDSLPDVDDDGDGFSDVMGDCNDNEPLVSPGAVEVQVKADGTAEGVDNDCDGLIDEAIEPCDSGLDQSDPYSYAKAMELCDFVTNATFNAEAPATARRIVSDFGVSYFPYTGSSMTVISSGIAGDAGDPGYVLPQGGTDFIYSVLHPDPQPAIGCSSSDPTFVQDLVELRLDITVPSNANSFAFDFNFMSAEYPEWVCTSYDDTFVAYLESSSFNGNISFDAMGNPVSINVGFFSVTGSPDLDGTGYEGGVGGGTGWLTTTAPATPGDNITLRFIVFDEGDGVLDSTTVIDNFRWFGEPVDAPITEGKPMGPGGK